MPFADEATCRARADGCFQKPSQSEGVEKVRPRPCGGPQRKAVMQRRAASLRSLLTTRFEALASHKINAGRGSVVEKARHKKL